LLIIYVFNNGETEFDKIITDKKFIEKELGNIGKKSKWKFKVRLEYDPDEIYKCKLILLDVLEKNMPLKFPQSKFNF